MGGALVPKHLFLILFLALSLAGIAFSACVENDGECPEGAAQCCSALCQVQNKDPDPSVSYCVACLNPGMPGCGTNDSNCCGGMKCRSGTCASCTCGEGDKFPCDAPCSADANCCSGLCSPTPGKCASCIASGDSCASHSGECCSGLSCNANGKCAAPASVGSGSGNWYDGVYTWTGLAVLMAAAFLGLAYMAAKLFELQVLDAWVRIELGELVKSMVIAVFCISLIESANIAASFLVGQSGDVITLAQDFQKTMYDDAHALYMKLAVVYFNVAKTASYSYTAGTSAGGYFSISYTSAPASGMSPLVGEVGQAMDAVANYMLLAATQAAFIRFFGTAAVVMLPLGVFLRSFSFTRKLGGTLLAATIAVAVIFPSSVLLSGEVYRTFSNEMKGLSATGAGEPFDNVRVTDAKNPPVSGVVCNEFMKTFVNSPIPLIGGELGWWIIICLPICSALPDPTGIVFTTCFGTTCKEIINLIFMIVKAAFPILIWLGVFLNFEITSTPAQLADQYFQPMLDYVLPAVAKFTVLSLVTFLIPIIITLSFLRSLAITFGGEAQLYGLSKMI